MRIHQATKYEMLKTLFGTKCLHDRTETRIGSNRIITWVHLDIGNVRVLLPERLAKQLQSTVILLESNIDKCEIRRRDMGFRISLLELTYNCRRLLDVSHRGIRVG